jgi:hypothetical protein
MSLSRQVLILCSTEQPGSVTPAARADLYAGTRLLARHEVIDTEGNAVVTAGISRIDPLA